MRHAFILSMGLALVGCSGPKVDDTVDRMGQEVNYPAGPYGYTVGTVIQNIDFRAKWDPEGHAGTASYAQMPLAPLSLANYHNDADVKYLVLSGVAGWCGPCNDEQEFVPQWQAKFEPRGFRFLEAMMQGYNARSGAAATEADINRWQDIHQIRVAIALDPEAKIFQYADVSAFPLNMVLRTSDMQIVYMQVGLQDLESVLDGLP